MSNSSQYDNEINLKLEKIGVILNSSLKSNYDAICYSSENGRVVISSKCLVKEDIIFLDKLFKVSNKNQKSTECLFTYAFLKDLNEDFMNESYNRISENDNESLGKIKQVINQKILNSDIDIKFDNLNRYIKISCKHEFFINKIENLLKEFFNGEVRSEGCNIISLKLNDIDKDKLNEVYNKTITSAVNTSFKLTNQGDIDSRKLQE